MSFLRLAGQIRKFSQSSVLRYEVIPFQNKIGTREVVGFGMNNQPTYVDSTVFPYPAVRFREITPNIKALKEKEKGNWKSLTKDEKKCIYRVSFCQTLAEVQAPSGRWKDIFGSVLLFLSGALWFHLMILYLIKEKLPESYDLEHQQAQLQRMIDIRVNPITGLASKWDYEKKKWKE